VDTRNIRASAGKPPPPSRDGQSFLCHAKVLANATAFIVVASSHSGRGPRHRACPETLVEPRCCSRNEYICVSHRHRLVLSQDNGRGDLTLSPATPGRPGIADGARPAMRSDTRVLRLRAPTTARRAQTQLGRATPDTAS